ncbi:DUF4199 domain-containing protein [Jiulongibacter sp. NS-SX5]|uniref:DUF4199 domain-containing protein n=1 Tax=Jiulongibacter sp. NS-SX5 TaxID=3463854 RepID=UPI0040583DA4
MEQKPSTAQIALKWGVIAGLAGLVLTTVMYMTDLWKSSAASFLIGIAVSVFMLVMAMKEFKEANGGFMTFGEGLGVGMLASVISAIIGTIYNQVYMKFIDTGFPDKMKDFQIEKMEGQGLSEEQIETALQMSEKFTTGGLSFIMPLVAAIIFSFILSLIVAAIMKKNKPVF